jgi:sugar (pentulose or hexulose) kinase
MDDYLLVFDVGSGTARVAVFDPAGRCVASVAQGRTHPSLGCMDSFALTFDAEELWAQLCALTRELLAKSAIPASLVRAVTATSQRHSCVFLDRAGSILCACPNQDGRGFYAQEYIEERMGKEIYTITGQWPPVISSLARLLWHRLEEKELYSAVDKVLMLNDWITYKLCGEFVSEPSAASSSMILDVGRRAWSQAVIDCFSLAPSMLPALVDAGQSLGRLSPSAARQTGLGEETLVVMSGGDTHCALLAAGVLQAGDVGIVAGTTTPVCRIADRPVIDPEEKIWTTCHLMPGQWALDSNAQWTGAIYQWLHQFVREEFAEALDSDSCYAAMEKKARGVPPGSNDTYAFLGSVILDAQNFFVLRPGMFLFPPPTHPMVEKPTTLGHLIRATLENIVYAIYGNLGHLLRVLKDAPPCETMYATGGLTRSSLFVEILADCTGMPVAVSHLPEGTALGAALCASVGAGIYRDLAEAARHMVHTETRASPVPEHTSVYRNAFERWRDLYHVIADL